MQKNLAGQFLELYAFDSTTNAPKTGDAANLTAYRSIDGGALTILGDTSATEISATNAPGWYRFDLTQGETNGDDILFTCKSSTANVVIQGRAVTTTPVNFADILITAGGTVNADMVAISTDTAAADALETMLDGTGGNNFKVAAFQVGQEFSVGGNFDVTGNFDVEGAVLFRDDVVVTGLSTFTGGITVSGATTLAGAVALQSTLAITGTTTFTGAVTAAHASNDIRGILLQSTQTFSNTGTWTGNITGNLSGSVGSVTGAVGSVAGNVGGNVTGSVGSIATGGIAAASFAPGAIDAAAIATDAATEIGNNASAAVTTAHGVGSYVNTGGGPGGGPYVVTVTVTDGTDPLVGAYVAITAGVNRYTLLTDIDGQGDFGVDADTYTVAISKAGYTFTPTTRTVTGTQTGTLTQDLEMTATIIPSPPADPTRVTVYGYFTSTNTGRPVPGVQLEAILTPKGAAYSGGILIGERITAISDSDGLAQIEVIKNSEITHHSGADTEWNILATKAGINFTQAIEATLDISTAIQ